MKKTVIILGIILMLILSGCKTVEDVPNFPANLLGIIFDNYNNPVGGASVSIADDERIFTSDIDGRFILPNLDKAKYTITVSKEGFETNTIEIDLYDPKQVLYVKLSSIAWFKEQIEGLIKSKDWKKVERMIERASKIDGDDPVFLYLSTIYALNIEDYNRSTEYLNTLKMIGYKTEAVNSLEKEIEKRRSQNSDVQ